MSSWSDKTYTTKELAELAGVSCRTLRYYDQIGLLVPARAQNGYRIYRLDDVRRLEHILLLRSCGMPLESIAKALDSAAVDIAALLSEHLAFLCKQREELDKTIAAARTALAEMEIFDAMNDAERFEQIKRQSVASFEEEFGEEARRRYGDEAIDAANARMLEMSTTAWEAKEDLEQRIKDQLTVAMATGDRTSPESKLVAGMHAQWIKVHWGEDSYSPAAHIALCEGYLADSRFIEYYDGACGLGATEFLRDIVRANMGADQ